jgi:hypothetical protein
LEGTESSIGVKMLTLLDDSFIIHSEKTFGYDFSKIQQ